MQFPTEDQVRHLILEKFRFHASRTFSLHALAPMMLNEAEIMREIDYAGYCFAATLYSYVVKGDTTHESKTCEFEYTFKVFKGWLDHLKYDVASKRILRWLPEFIRKKLKIQYIDITKKRTESYPISVVRVCPHATFKWEGREQFKHIYFLFPERLRDASDI